MADQVPNLPVPAPFPGAGINATRNPNVTAVPVARYLLVSGVIRNVPDSRSLPRRMPVNAAQTVEAVLVLDGAQRHGCLLQ